MSLKKRSPSFLSSSSPLASSAGRVRSTRYGWVSHAGGMCIVLVRRRNLLRWFGSRSLSPSPTPPPPPHPCFAPSPAFSNPTLRLIRHKSGALDCPLMDPPPLAPSPQLRFFLCQSPCRCGRPARRVRLALVVAAEARAMLMVRSVGMDGMTRQRTSRAQPVCR
ncbi:hypothetical protein SETIT_9G294300v2 [Setaria italica]|uniref:Uncharacterized protein n=1 Tax=Setaria italica TaxID=4555 RepID=A0A368SLX0_SETIT|nr:hypothetical protein SETIT_9G294300v2 [Setaria italica]